MVCLVVPDGWAEEDDTLEDTAIMTFQEIEDEDCLPAAGLTADYGRVAVLRENLRRISREH